jgi:hypothetical protein
VICAIKSNRRLGKVRVDLHNQTLRHKPYQMVKLAAVDNQTPARTYHVRAVHGQIEDVAQEVYVIISKKRPGDFRPKYFLCSDLSLSAEEALRIYQKRCLSKSITSISKATWVWVIFVCNPWKPHRNGLRS